LKIKPPSSANRRLAALRAINHQWWLMPAKPRKAGRLKQLNKHNKRQDSELITELKSREENK